MVFGQRLAIGRCQAALHIVSALHDATRGALREIDRVATLALREAARLDGCSDLRLLWRVVVPPSLAPMMTMAVVITMWTWNEFLLPLVMVSAMQIAAFAIVKLLR